MQKYYKYHDLTMSQFYTQGGIGNIYLSKYDKYIYKLTYSASAFINNILTFNKLVNKIPCSNLLDYFIIKNDNKLLYNFKDSLKSLSLKHLNEFNMDNIYVLKYSLYDYNTFGYYSNILYKDLLENLPYMIIWTYICIYSMNIQNIFHNDLKIDNILMKERFNDIIYIQNIVIGNNTKYEYFLNDFDMTLNKNIFDDITTFRNSVYRMFTKRLKNNNNLLNNINNINDIYERILLNPTNYTREMISINIL